MTTPEPVPEPPAVLTSTETTTGSTRLAMSATEPGGRLTEGLTWDSVASGSSSAGVIRSAAR